MSGSTRLVQALSLRASKLALSPPVIWHGTEKWEPKSLNYGDLSPLTMEKNSGLGAHQRVIFTEWACGVNTIGTFLAGAPTLDTGLVHAPWHDGTKTWEPKKSYGFGVVQFLL